MPKTDELPAGVPNTRGHPLLRVIIGAPTNYDGHIPPHINLFIEVVGKEFGWEKVRGVRTTPTPRAQGMIRMRQWFAKTPLIYTWAKSDRFLTAPDEWPDSVKVALMPNPVTPYEMSFFIGKLRELSSILPWSECILYAYCAGMTIEEIGYCLDLDTTQIVLQMEEAVKNFLNDHRFRIWNWGLNWNAVVIPPEVDDSLLTRMGIKSILTQGGLFEVKKTSEEYRHLGNIVNSSRMQRYAMYAPKALRHIPTHWIASGLVRLGKPKQS